MTGQTRSRPAPVAVADEVVLDAAAALLMSVGVRRTTFTDVARRAGVSRMTLYRRWPDLRSLVRDVMTREWGRIITATAPPGTPGTWLPAEAAARAYPDAPDPDPPGAERAGAERAELVGSLVAAARAFRAHPLFARITETDGELLVPYVLERLGTTQLLVLDLLRDRLAAAQATGAVRTGDPDAQARMVLLAAQSYVLSAGAMGDEVTRDALARELYLMVDGYLAPPHDPLSGSPPPEAPPPTRGAPSSRTRPASRIQPTFRTRPTEHRPPEHPGGPS
ncbi:TetR/AcrR family transcriptional regulator [Parafrankia elaeagni]|uniref:TetR/AcrR family transcriptional regulator n=1 Tax=Parafrankia elaeagni TaxID=222534 RepID=UPI00035DF845|nr:TetR/AcrR family transcriptional regulator [Parafrankia elaeagni]